MNIQQNSQSPEIDYDSYSAPNMTGGGSKTVTLLDHLFNFDSQYKGDILNVLQYAVISIIPLILLTKSIQYAIPDASSHGTSIEITIEIIGQLGMLLLGLILVHRFVTYFSTYSGEPYPKQSVLHFVLGFLTILISIQSKLGEKINILVDRLMESSRGGVPQIYHNKRKHSQKAPDVQVMGRHHSSNTNNDTTQISSLPVIDSSINSPPQQSRTGYDSSSQYAPNYDPATSSGPMMPPVGPMNQDEPTAANMALGGSFGSAW